MKLGKVLLLICCVCFSNIVISEIESQFQNETSKDFPGINIPQIVNNSDLIETTVLTDALFKPANLSETPARETNITTNNDNGNTMEEVKSSDLADAPHTEGGGSRRLGSSRYKSGRQQVSISQLTLSDDVPRHGALMHKTVPKFDTEKVQTGDKVDAGANQNEASDTVESSSKKKKRISTSSATPSVQIVILVIGAVVGCVLLTGFIRWRVRGRLNGKQKGMSDDFVIYHDRHDHQRDSEMGIIFECECEEGRGLLHSHDSEESCVSFQDGSKFDEISCSRRFDTPLSLMSHTYSAGNNSRLPRPRSPKSGRDLELIRGTKRQIRRKYGHKGRYYRHQKRRLENMFVQKLETIPMENSVPTHEDYRQTDRNEHHPSTSSQPPPLLLQRSSPPAQRAVIATLLDSWRSLSFNRDWVGRMWQEQHNIRRISDLLRGRTTTRDSDSESSRPVSIISDTSTSSERHSISEEDELSAPRQRSILTAAPDNVCDHISVNEPDHGVAVVRALSGEPTGVVDPQNGYSSVENDNAGLACGGIVPDNNNGEVVPVNTSTSIPPTNCGQISRTDHFHRFWPFSDLEEEPPEYASLLDNEHHLRSTASSSGIERGRYLGRRRKRRLEDRERANRLFSRCGTADLGDACSEPISTRVRDEPSPFTHIHRRQSQPLLANTEPLVSDTFSLPAPVYQSERNQAEEQELSLNAYPNQPNGVSVPTIAPQFVAQMVIEQLSDGAQIVYIPPPALPSYHNDTPPPYQQ